MTFNSVPQSIGLALFKVHKKDKEKKNGREKRNRIRSVYFSKVFVVGKRKHQFEHCDKYTQISNKATLKSNETEFWQQKNRKEKLLLLSFVCFIRFFVRTQVIPFIFVLFSIPFFEFSFCSQVDQSIDSLIPICLLISNSTIDFLLLHGYVCNKNR